MGGGPSSSGRLAHELAAAGRPDHQSDPMSETGNEDVPGDLQKTASPLVRQRAMKNLTVSRPATAAFEDPRVHAMRTFHKKVAHRPARTPCRSARAKKGVRSAKAG